MISRHAELRCQQRGVSTAVIGAILDHADIDRPIGNNCRLLRVSKLHAATLRQPEKLGRYAIIWSDDHSRIVTVLPIQESARGARYRRIQ